MYAYIKGKITFKSPTMVYMEANGVGYALQISLNTYSALESEDSYKLWTHLIVREDDLSLYGFSSQNERDLFVLLISVSGIGPNTARIVLSSLKPEEVKRAIMYDDVPTFKAVKGIGPKTAQRLIIELKDKIIKLDDVADMEPSTLTDQNSIKTTRNEAMQALLALGFQSSKINKVLNELTTGQENVTTETLIKEALRLLS